MSERKSTKPSKSSKKSRTVAAAPAAAQADNALIRWLHERKITEIECLVPDMTGNARGKIVPIKKFSHDNGTRLSEGLFATSITGEYPEEYYELVLPSDSDMVLRPDPDAACLVPWTAEPTAQIIHDCYTHDGRPHPLAPRNVLKRVIAEYDKLGLKPIVAPEIEFYLVQKNIDPDLPLVPPIGRSGRAESAHNSYSIDAVNEYDPIIDLMYDYCEAMELDVDTLIHETGAGQLEVNLNHADPLSRADQVFLFKRAMRESALRHGVYATFLAKPMENEPGSAMHIHQSLVDAKTGRNVFAGRKDGEQSELFRHYIGGLQKYTPACMALFAPNVNSYRRLVFGEISPKNVMWGYDNRTCGFRVPRDSAENTRIENRFAGSDANPYLAMAFTLACGLLGIKEKLEPTAPTSASVGEEVGYSMTETLVEALNELEACKPLHEVLGERFVRTYIAVKRVEYMTYFRVISSWEREFLLLSV